MSFKGPRGCLFLCTQFLAQCFVPTRLQRIFKVQLACVCTHAFSSQPDHEPLSAENCDLVLCLPPALSCGAAWFQVNICRQSKLSGDSCLMFQGGQC